MDKKYPDDYPFRVVIVGTGALALAFDSQDRANSELERMNRQAEELGIEARYEVVVAE